MISNPNSTIAQLQAQLATLLSQIAAIQNGSSSGGSSSSTVAGSVAFTRTLKAGSVGSDVRALQVALNTLGFTIAKSGPGSPGKETTRFGTATRKAVQKFQITYDIAATGDSGYGRVGPKTRAKLQALLSTR